jgi:hypothetical protein
MQFLQKIHWGIFTSSKLRSLQPLRREAKTERVNPANAGAFADWVRLAELGAPQDT